MNNEVRTVKWDSKTFIKLQNEDGSESHFLSAIVGPSDCGKTTLVKYIIKESVGVFDFIFVCIKSNPGLTNSYTDVVWPDNIFYAPTDDSVAELKTQLKSYARSISDFNNQNDKNIKGVKTLLIVDDFQVKDLTTFIGDGFVNYCRHSKISIMILAHRFNNIPKSIRDVISHYFISIKLTDDLNIITKNKKKIQAINNNIQRILNDNKLSKNFLLHVENEPNKLYLINLTREDVEKNKEIQPHFFNYSIQISKLKEELKKLVKTIKKIKK